MTAGDAIWLAHGGNAFDAAYDPAPTSATYAAAADLFPVGNILLVPALLLGVPAVLYTPWAYWRRPHRGPTAGTRREQRLARGLELGAVVAAASLAVLAPVVATVADPSLSLPASSTGLRLALLDGGLVLAVVLVTTGFALDLRGTRWARQGRVLLWIGTSALTVASLLDSWAGTSLSGTTGRYVARSFADPTAYGGVLDHCVGAGSFVPAAATAAPLLAVVVEHGHGVADMRADSSHYKRGADALASANQENRLRSNMREPAPRACWTEECG